MNVIDARKKVIPGSPILVNVALVIGILLCYLVLHLITRGKLLTTTNILFVLSASVVTTFVVLAFCFLITMGIMDLSLGSIMILASNAGGILAVEFNLGYIGLIGGAVLVAVILEMANVKMMLISKIPPWIFGLGIAMLYEAIGAAYNTSQLKVGKQMISLGTVCRELGDPPWNLVVMGLGLLAAYALFNRTSIGFGLRAVGSNSTVARMMGINTGRATILAALCAGVFIGFASAINQSYANRVTANTGLTSIAAIFTPLAAYLLAKALEKFFNIIIGAVVSAVIITSIFNALTLLRVPSGTWQQVVMGGIVLLCGILSQRRFKGVVK